MACSCSPRLARWQRISGTATGMTSPFITWRKRLPMRTRCELAFVLVAQVATTACMLRGVVQVFTQHAYKRSLGCNIMLCGCGRVYALMFSTTISYDAVAAALTTSEAPSCSRWTALATITAIGCVHSLPGCHVPRLLAHALFAPRCSQAAAAGTKEQEATNNLEKKFKSGSPTTLEETLDVAITALQAVSRHAALRCVAFYYRHVL
jgi:20S proteasome alpha/beta subunit